MGCQKSKLCKNSDFVAQPDVMAKLQYTNATDVKERNVSCVVKVQPLRKSLEKRSVNSSSSSLRKMQKDSFRSYRNMFQDVNIMQTYQQMYFQK